MSDSSSVRLNGRTVATALVADTWRTRLRGVLLRRELPEALWLTPENSVHGIGMRSALDVALVGADGVVRSVLVLRPWGMTRPRRHVTAVLEAPRGSFGTWGLQVGDLVTVDPRT
ncbi:DUF192 domain-containing protein [Cellulomonas soli]|uniref:DUF192 domain-containing protein n=1 Tax=Cellulomonas soli TaxID=931535 RepID=UPI003F877402